MAPFTAANKAIKSHFGFLTTMKNAAGACNNNIYQIKESCGGDWIIKILPTHLYLIIFIVKMQSFLSVLKSIIRKADSLIFIQLIIFCVRSVLEFPCYFVSFVQYPLYSLFH